MFLDRDFPFRYRYATRGYDFRTSQVISRKEFHVRHLQSNC
jgi:hypothetical protein